MRRGRLWVGMVAAALVAVSGTGAHAAPLQVEAAAAGAAPSAATEGVDPAGAMHVLPARRVLDTRSGLGAPAGPRIGGSTTSVIVTGHGGVPASGVGAVVLHVTVANATGSGYVSAYPGGSTPPVASTLNVRAGQAITNMAVVPVDPDGVVSVRYSGSGTVHLLADVAGWVTAGEPTEPGTTTSLVPTRLMDTRTGLGGSAGPLAAGSMATLQVTGRGGVPATIGSVTLNVTAVSPTAGGWLAMTPVDPGPGKVGTSSVNFVAGQTIANAVTTALSPTGTVDLRLSAGASAHVVVDVVAWTVAGTPAVKGTLLASTPVRLLDTRSSTWSVPVEAGGVAAVTAGAGAVVLNVTAVGAQRAGHVVIAAEGGGTPVASQLSVPVSAARAALVIVPAGGTGRVRLTASTTMHLVVDRVGTVAQPVLAQPLPGAPPSLTAVAQGSAVALSWTTATGATGYVVRRIAGRTPASPYQGHEIWNARSGAMAVTDTTGAPGVGYTYAVYARDGVGNLSEPAMATATTAPLVWTAGARVSAYAGGPVDVSCPTTTWCLAVGRFGESWVWSGGTWASSGSVSPDPDNPYSYDFAAVSCPTTTFCLAVLNGQGVATWQGGVWTRKDTTSSYSDVSCWSTTACGLVTSWGGATAAPEFERWTSGTIGGGVAISGRSGAASLSCPSTVCSFITYASGTTYVHRVSGTTVTTKSMGAGGGEAQLSCATSTWCMAVVDGKYRTGYGTTWSAAKPAGEGSIGVSFFVTMDLSCPTTTSCTLVGILGGGASDAGAMRWNGSTWSERGLGTGLNTERAVDCASASQCLVVDERGRYHRWSGSAWTARTTFANSRGGFASLDCVAATSCLATDDYGNVLQWAGGATWPRASLSEGRSYADCAQSTCMTVDVAEDTWRARRAGTWGPTSKGTLRPYSAPLCVTSSRCFALSGSTYLQWDGGSSWGDYHALPVDLGSAATGDCPTTTFCLAVAPGGRAVQWNGTRWVSRGRAPLPDGAGVTIDCVSAAFCMAMADGAAAMLTATGWRSVPRSYYGLTGLACRSPILCLAHANGVLAAWDGAEWALTSMQVGDPMSSGLISCVGTSRCVVAAGEKVWWTS